MYFRNVYKLIRLLGQFISGGTEVEFIALLINKNQINFRSIDKTQK